MASARHYPHCSLLCETRCLQNVTISGLSLLSSVDFFQKIHLSGTPSVSNSLNPEQGRCSVGPYLGPNYLQRPSADNS